MSDAAESHAEQPSGRPGPHLSHDSDAWASACASEPTEETARRRERPGRPPTDPAAEPRGLAESVAGHLGLVAAELGDQAAPLAARARTALAGDSEAVRHLTRAGEEVVAACAEVLAAVSGRRDPRPDGSRHETAPGSAAPEQKGRPDGPGDAPGHGHSQRIDLD